MNKILNKLNKYFSDYYINPSTLHKNQDPSILLNHHRMDVVIKIIYAEYYLGITQTNLNRVLYYYHLKKLNNFKGKDTDKNTFIDYEISFQNTIDSIKTKGFDSNKTIIPVDKLNRIIDGSHRLGASIVLKKGIDVLKFNSIAPTINLKRLNDFFNLKKNGLILDYLITNFIKYSKNLRLITLFPVRNKKLDDECINIIKEFGDVVLTKSFGIGNLANGYHIVKNFYFGAPWIGNLQNNYQGAEWKTKSIIGKSNGIIDVILFNPHRDEFATLEHLKKIKEKIRSIYKIHYHSIHSSDNHEETIRYSKLFFDYNSQKLLTKRTGIFYNKFESILEKFIITKKDHHNFVFSGSAVMAALGLREPKDFDVFHTEDLLLPNELSSHNSQIIYLKGYSINELIFNPKNYFYYMGYKFLNLNIILRMKVNRYSDKPKEKDKVDIDTIRQFLNKN